MQQVGLGTPPMRGHITISHSTKYTGFTRFQDFAM